MRRLTARQFAIISIIAAVATILLKLFAYVITGSVGLLSDALESGVNLVAALIAFLAIVVAALPPDDEHTYGHTKAEYFSSGVEGTLIFIAAITIIIAAVDRFQHPQPLEQIGVGLFISAVAAVLNLVVARILRWGGQLHHSVALTADADHLLTDVWTTGGVIGGVILAWISGWSWLDPLTAMLVALQIMVVGGRILRDSIRGLMDTAVGDEEMHKIVEILDSYEGQGVTYHALRSRQSGSQRFVSVHIQVPGSWSVLKGHSLLEEIEQEMRRALPRLSTFTHLEPLEDPVSWLDIELNRT